MDDAAVGRVGGRDGLAAGHLQSRQESMDPRIGAGKRVVRRQDRLDVSTAEGHGICKSGRRVAKHILGSDAKASRNARGILGGKTADGQMGCGGGVDRDARLTAGHGAGHCIKDG